jgi:tetratricopeptide (TPR) repeat protein
MLRRVLFGIFTLGMLSGFAALHGAEGDGTDAALWQYLLNRSKVLVDSCKLDRVMVTDKEWADQINKVFDRIKKASGKNEQSFSGFEQPPIIIENKSFNMTVLPNGQLIINSKVLEVASELAAAKMKGDGDGGKKRGFAYYREAFIAPLIAHEMSHYANQHLFFTYKKCVTAGENDNNAAAEKVLQLDDIRYAPEFEFDADRDAFLWLGKTGQYDPACLVSILEFLNTRFQDEKGKAAADGSGSVLTYSQNRYLVNHPTPNERLSKLEHGDKAFRERMFKLEIAFDNIQLGKNLDDAIGVIDEALKLYPGNIHLLKGRAVACHKKWLSSAQPEGLTLKTIVNIPAYRDQMVFKDKKRGTRGGKKIPGTLALYNDAIACYVKTVSVAPDSNNSPAVEARLIDAAADADFLSYYGALLCYDSIKADQALQIAEKAKKMKENTTTLSNYILVLYVKGEEEKAMKACNDLVGKMKDLDLRVRNDGDAIQGLQRLDKTYVYDGVTPVLNRALMLQYAADLSSKEEEKSAARSAAKQYFNKYDKDSAWAEYLSLVTTVKINKGGKSKRYAVNRIMVGDSSEKVLKEWKAPSYKVQMPHSESWVYEKLGVRISIDDFKVSEIIIDSASGPRVADAIGVGMKREAVEKVLGKSKRTSGSDEFYGAQMNIIVTYGSDDVTVERIMLTR